jgi:DNA polymerase-3 subunit beta
MPYGELTIEMRTTIQPYVEGRNVWDLGAGDLTWAAILQQLGAHVTAVDKRLMGDLPGAFFYQGTFADLAKQVCALDVAFVSWPCNYRLPGLGEILSKAPTVIYLGSNSAARGDSCGGPGLWRELFKRPLLSSVENLQNTLLVYGPGEGGERILHPEEREAFLQWFEGERMDFEIEKRVFLNLLSRVKGVCKGKGSSPFQVACLLEKTPEGLLQARSTDLEVSITTSIEGANFLEKEKESLPQDPSRDFPSLGLLLPAHRLFNTVQSLPEGMVTLQIEEKRKVLLKSGPVEVHMVVGFDPEQFPILPVMEEKPVEFPASVLLDMMEKVVFCISSDETRASFTGAFFRFLPGKDNEHTLLQMASTDGHRLAKIEVSQKLWFFGSQPELSRGIIIPKTGLLEACHNFSKEGTIQVCCQQPKDSSKWDLLLSQGSTTISINLISARFPRFDKVIPETEPNRYHHLKVLAGTLQKALKRASLYVPRAQTVRFKTKANERILELHSCDPHGGDYTETLKCEYEGEGVAVGLNYHYILELLKVIEDEEVRIYIAKMDPSYNPVVFRDKARPETIYIVMPMEF